MTAGSRYLETRLMSRKNCDLPLVKRTRADAKINSCQELLTPFKGVAWCTLAVSQKNTRVDLRNRKRGRGSFLNIEAVHRRGTDGTDGTVGTRLGGAELRICFSTSARTTKTLVTP